MKPAPDHRTKFVELLRDAMNDGALMKLTLGKHRGADPTLQNLFVRPVALKRGPQLALVWRHATRDVTKNHPPLEALALIEPLIGGDFLDAHLFTATQNAQLECTPDGAARLRIGPTAAGNTPPAARSSAHDREKSHLIPADAPWLRALGVTNDQGKPREGMADKFRQIQKFSELLAHLVAEAGLIPRSTNDRPEKCHLLDDTTPKRRLEIVDMGSGKGYLTFATAALLGSRANVRGVEIRPELVELCSRIARENNFSNLSFTAGRIEEFETVDRKSKIVNPPDVLIALHACDTATDDALAQGIAAGAELLVVAPCCQKELRTQLAAPTVLADALRHGIFQERQAEFATDALRAQLLEWAGYRTKVFEFISTEHTAKNLMIAAIKARPPGDAAVAKRVREFAAFYGVRSQKLASHLQFPLSIPEPSSVVRS